MGELYIYKCRMCGKEFEMYHRIEEPIHEVKCKECGSLDSIRLISHEHKGAVPRKIKHPKKNDDK